MDDLQICRLDELLVDLFLVSRTVLVEGRFVHLLLHVVVILLKLVDFRVELFLRFSFELI